jgi:hypothetical protein
MNSRFEALFSPKNLRQHWQSSPAPVVLQEPTYSTIQSHFLQLQGLIANQFTDISPLVNKLEQIQQLIDSSFSGDCHPTDAEQQQALLTLLEELEELLWAVELAQQTPL